MSAIERCYNIADLRQAARKRLPKGIFEYIDLGTEEGIALADNRAAFDRIRLVPRYMVDLSAYDFSTTLLGRRSSLPFGIAPTGISGLCWRDGDVALARAAADAGIPFALALTTITPMERVTQVGGQLWFQLYVWDEVELSHAIVDRARRLGFDALVVTIDSALGRVREHNERNGFDFPFKPNWRALVDMVRRPRWLTSVLLRPMLTSGLPTNANFPPQYRRMIAWRGTPKPNRHAAMTWRDIATLRDLWPGKLIVKSVLSPEDARLAVDHGADAIIVSNHGGRSMDSAMATIDALPGIVEAVGRETQVIVDSGVRRGSDIVKALALGADFVMVGRATLYGLAAGGLRGVQRAIEILASEFEKTMGYLGCRSVDELGPEVVARPPFGADALFRSGRTDASESPDSHPL